MTPEKTPSSASPPPPSPPDRPHEHAHASPSSGPAPALQPSMAVFEIDPHRFIPAGFDIEDGGADRLPRTFYTPVVPPPRAHEQYMVAIVEPIPPPELVGVRRQ